MGDELEIPCPICGATNLAGATTCSSCGFALVEAPQTQKMDALLDDLLELSEKPVAEPDPAPVEEAADVDEAVAEQLFDSLLVEIRPSDTEPPISEETDFPEVVSPEPPAEVLGDVDRVPVLATPAETEGKKLHNISGRIFDLVTLGSVGALFAVFLVFRMYETLFDPSRPFGVVVFAAVAASGMAAALVLFHLSNSAVAQGDRLVKQGRYQDALVHYERAIRMVRRPSYAWTSRGVAMKYLGRLGEAQRCHENAIRLDSENEVAWCNLGTVYFKKGELGKALECYGKAIKLRPKYAIAWNNKGVVFARLNRFEDAEKCHAKATQLRPEYVAAWLNRGEILTRLGARDEAQKCLERARAISRSAAAA
jgi:Flp pilus assembly protein TadD